MDTIKTQFIMSGVPTDVTVQELEGNRFACTLNLADFFDGGELEGADAPPDVIINRSPGGDWQITGESRVTLTEHDIQMLGKAIEEDYLDRKESR